MGAETEKKMIKIIYIDFRKKFPACFRKKKQHENMTKNVVDFPFHMVYNKVTKEKEVNMRHEISLSVLAGINLKRLIKKSKYRTQEAFAYQFGAEIRTVSRWLNSGIRNIDTIKEIADFFAINMLELLKNEETKGE